MKSKKLFAILTLVAFMMTLLPVAAFAADEIVAVKGASKIAVNASSKSTGSDVEVTVALRGVNGAATTLKDGEALYIWAERTEDSLSDVDNVKEIEEGVYAIKAAGKDKITAADFAYAEVLSNGIVKVKDIAGESTVKVKYTSSVAGEVTFKAALATSDDVVGQSGVAIGSQSFEWKQLGADVIVLDTDKLPAGVSVDEDKTNEDAGLYALKGFQADGDEYELTFEVQDKNGVPLAGEKVTFALNKSGANLNKTEATTDVLGQVKVKVYAYEADDYKLTVKKGSKVAIVNMDFSGSDDAFEIEAPAAITDKVALDTHPTLEFKVYDVFGNRILGGAEATEDSEATGLYKVAEEIGSEGVVFSKKPAGSDLEDDDLSIEVNEDENALVVVFDQEPDVAGTYEIKVKLDNGKFATVSFEAAEQGEITKLAIDYKQNYLAYGQKSERPTVKYYDNNRVFYEEENPSAVEFSVSDVSLAKVDENGVVTANQAQYNNFNTGKVVITAIDTARGLIATDEMTIGSLIAGLEVAVPEEATLVNEAATLTYQLVNQNGDPIAFNAVDNDGNSVQDKIEVDVYVVSAPEGAEVDVNLPLKSDYQKSLSRTGKVDVEVECSEPGTVALAFVVKGVAPGQDDKITLSNTTEVKFVAERVKIGAESITLFIGSTGYVVDGQPMVSDLAPFIKDNRTFVPVRIVAEALGATNKDTMWDEATQTVTLEREDRTITMTIGSNEIKLSDGTTITSDVAPFIHAETGRTVLPFRVIAEAFGADVEAIYAADGTTLAVTFEQ